MRRLLDRPGMVEAPGVYDVFSAKIAERLGFEVLYLGSSLVAASSYGLPDIGIVKAGEFIEHARRVVAAVDIPIILDLDDAGGTPQQIMRTVAAAEQVGVAAFHIEDLETSQGKHLVEQGPGGYDFGKETLMPVAKAVANIREAVNARTNPDTVIVGRTDAAAVTGVDDAIERANAYADAGADMIKFAHLGLEDLEKVAANTTKPILYYNLKTPPEDKEIAQRAGVKIRFHPFATLFAAMEGVIAQLTELRDTGAMPGLDTVPSYTEAQDYVDAAEWAARARQASSGPNATNAGSGSSPPPS
jgi:2-methylisocitrate lyase-like PEP mutase family enzyme